MSVPVLTSIGNILPQLHRTDSALTGSSSNAAISADLVWFTKKELIRWFDESLKALAKKAAVFVVRSTSTALVAGTAAYNAPSRHLATLYVAHLNKPLDSTSTYELEGRDRNFATTQGTPKRWYEDKIGVNKISLHPVPTSSDVAAGALEVVYTEYPADVDEDEANTTMPVPMVVADYLEARVLMEAYNKESDIRMPEVANQLSQFTSLIESAIVNYFGPNQ